MTLDYNVGDDNGIEREFKYNNNEIVMILKENIKLFIFKE